MRFSYCVFSDKGFELIKHVKHLLDLERERMFTVYLLNNEFRYCDIEANILCSY